MLFFRFFLNKIVVGEGWDYIVFESSNYPDRVIKILRPFWKQIWSRKLMPWRLIEIFANRHARRDHMLRTAQGLRPIIAKHSYMFANPIFIGTTYTQDRVVSLRDYFKTCSKDEIKRLLKLFYLFQIKCWKLGFSDQTFKFSSYGLDKNGNLVMIDLSEMTFDESRIDELIKSKRWLRTMDATTLPPDLSSYFRNLHWEFNFGLT